MNIKEFQLICEQRSKRWLQEEEWSFLETIGAMCGESGEAANIAKKIKRLKTKLPNKEKGLDIINYNELRMKMCMEVADSIIYGFKLLSDADCDAEVVLRLVFDEKSIEY